MRVDPAGRLAYAAEVMVQTFHRMSAAGNAFYLAIGASLPVAEGPLLSRSLCEGARLRALAGADSAASSDGLILGDLSSAALPRQWMFNPDGSRGHCANGLRCLAWLLTKEAALPRSGRIRTDDGEIPVRVEDDWVEASFAALRPLPGCPPPDRLCRVDLPGETLEGYAGYVGNPQFVVYGDAALQARLEELGSGLQRHPLFPEGVNVQLVMGDPRRPDDARRVRVWERGVGETRSCGTGALAVATVGPSGLARGGRRTLDYPGGPLTVRRDENDGLHLSGQVVYEGRYALAPEGVAGLGGGEGGAA